MTLRPLDIPMDRLRLQFEDSDDEDRAAARQTSTATHPAPSHLVHARDRPQDDAEEPVQGQAEDDGWEEEAEDEEDALDWEDLREGAAWPQYKTLLPFFFGKVYSFVKRLCLAHLRVACKLCVLY